MDFSGRGFDAAERIGILSRLKEVFASARRRRRRDH
jgi:hypothetical protein